MPVAYNTGSFFSNSLLLQDLLLVLVHPTLNLRTHRFTLDFVITFCAPYTTRILTQISLLETFSIIKNQITLHCLSLDTPASVTAIVIFLVINCCFICVLAIPSVTYACSFSTTKSPHMENG